MHITDPVADMLTRIRNANNAKHDTVDVPASNMKKSIAQILLDEGYIKNFQVVEDGTQGVIHISLKYNAGKEKVITGLRRVSKPGLRVYVGADELPRVLRGLGIAIISTSKGVMTDKKARELHVAIWRGTYIQGLISRMEVYGRHCSSWRQKSGVARYRSWRAGTVAHRTAGTRPCIEIWEFQI